MKDLVVVFKNTHNTDFANYRIRHNPPISSTTRHNIVSISKMAEYVDGESTTNCCVDGCLYMQYNKGKCFKHWYLS